MTGSKLRDLLRKSHGLGDDLLAGECRPSAHAAACGPVRNPDRSTAPAGGGVAPIIPRSASLAPPSRAARSGWPQATSTPARSSRHAGMARSTGPRPPGGAPRRTARPRYRGRGPPERSCPGLRAPSQSPRRRWPSRCRARLSSAMRRAAAKSPCLTISSAR